VTDKLNDNLADKPKKPKKKKKTKRDKENDKIPVHIGD